MIEIMKEVHKDKYDGELVENIIKKRGILETKES